MTIHGSQQRRSNLDSQEGNEEPSSNETPEQPHESTHCTNVKTDEGAEKTMIKSMPLQGELKSEENPRVSTRTTRKPDRWGNGRCHGYKSRKRIK